MAIINELAKPYKTVPHSDTTSPRSSKSGQPRTSPRLSAKEKSNPVTSPSKGTEPKGSSSCSAKGKSIPSPNSSKAFAMSSQRSLEPRQRRTSPRRSAMGMSSPSGRPSEKGEIVNDSLPDQMDLGKSNRVLYGLDAKHSDKIVSMKKLLTYKFDWYSLDIVVRNSILSMLTSYQEGKKEGHKKTLALALENHGGFILRDPKDQSVLAAAVIEMEHYRECEDPKDNHYCAIIHFHSPFNEHLTTLWTMIGEYLRIGQILRKTLYIYYARVNSAGLTLCQKLIKQREKFLRDYKFDLDDKPCRFDGGQFVASVAYQPRSRKKARRPSFLTKAGPCPATPYDATTLYNLPVSNAVITHHKDIDVFTCTYDLQYFGARTVLIDDLPHDLATFRGKSRKLEYERICEELRSSDQKSLKMDLNRAGSVASGPANRCCSYDCVWKMLKFNSTYMDEEVSTKMLKDREDDHAQFEDLRIMSKKKDDERKTLCEIVQSHGYEMVYLRDDTKKKVVKKLLFQEVFDKNRIGMFVCILRCVHGATTHAVGIAKSENGEAKVYDSNHAKPMNLSLENLNKCLQTAECDSFDMVVELRKKR